MVGGRKEGYGGERTGLWALKKLNWTNASRPQKHRNERNGLPGKWPSSLLYMGCKSVLAPLTDPDTHTLTPTHMI